MITIQASWEWWVIFVWSIVPYTPLIVGAIKNPKDESHNALVWSLYTMLDGITFLTGIRMLKTLNPVVMGLTMEGRENADPMVLGFAVGSLIMALILFYQKRFARWGVAEVIAITLTFIGITLWIFSGPHYAFLFSIFSEIVVGGYLIYKTFKKPTLDYNFLSYIGFLIVSSMSVITTAKWTVSEVGYAVSETCLNILILVPLFPLWMKKKFPGLYLKSRERRLVARRYLGRKYFYVQVAISVILILLHKRF